MNIREVETATSLKKTNIRYYEQQGLLTPKRNERNNYREYESEHVEALKKIKFLRVLGISINDIQGFQRDEISLSQLMKHRILELEEEFKELEDIHKICKQLETCDETFINLEVSLIDKDENLFKIKGDRIIRLDRVNKLESYLEGVRLLMCLAASIWGILYFFRLLFHYEVPKAFGMVHLGVVICLIIIYCYLTNKVTKYRNRSLADKS